MNEAVEMDGPAVPSGCETAEIFEAMEASLDLIEAMEGNGSIDRETTRQRVAHKMDLDLLKSALPKLQPTLAFEEKKWKYRR